MDFTTTDATDNSATTGIEGLDSVLAGGLQRGRVYLIEGVPGSGKTTLSLQFLLEGVRHGERVLYVTLSETEDELRVGAASHGWSLDGVTIRELIPPDADMPTSEQYTMFHPSEVELGQVLRKLWDDVRALQPSRMVLDSLSELRLLAGSPLRYRRQILALKQFLASRGATVLLLDDLTAGDRDLQVQSVAHGVIHLDNMSPEYGAERRRLRVVKYRGRGFRGGYHDYTMRRGGLRVFPRLVAAETRREPTKEMLPSGIPAFDDLLGGGLDRGSSTLIVGAAGTGKSTIATQFVWAAAQRGEKALMFVFDESIGTLISRVQGMGFDLRPHVESGLVRLQQVDPAELSPGELAFEIRQAVTEDNINLVVIDSLNGYLNAMPDEKFLVIQLHELLMFLGQNGVSTMLVGTQSGLIGNMQTVVDASYLADSVIMLRYFETQGAVRQAISVVKKRSGAHERTIRELRFSADGIHIGEPLTNFRGVLTGVPVPLDAPSKAAPAAS